MSLPDYLLEPYADERECIACGSTDVEYGSLCNECTRALADKVADEKVTEWRR